MKRKPSLSFFVFIAVISCGGKAHASADKVSLVNFTRGEAHCTLTLRDTIWQPSRKGGGFEQLTHPYETGEMEIDGVYQLPVEDFERQMREWETTKANLQVDCTSTKMNGGPDGHACIRTVPYQYSMPLKYDSSSSHLTIKQDVLWLLMQAGKQGYEGHEYDYACPYIEPRDRE